MVIVNMNRKTHYSPKEKPCITIVSVSAASPRHSRRGSFRLQNNVITPTHLSTVYFPRQFVDVVRKDHHHHHPSSPTPTSKTISNLNLSEIAGTGKPRIGQHSEGIVDHDGLSADVRVCLSASEPCREREHGKSVSHRIRMTHLVSPCILLKAQADCKALR